MALYFKAKKSATTVVADFFALNYLFAVILFIANRKPIVIAIPRGNRTNALCINGAIRYITKEIIATLIAYGSCVETWLMWLH